MLSETHHLFFSFFFFLSSPSALDDSTVWVLQLDQLSRPMLRFPSPVAEGQTERVMCVLQPMTTV